MDGLPARGEAPDGTRPLTAFSRELVEDRLCACWLSSQTPREGNGAISPPEYSDRADGLLHELGLDATAAGRTLAAYRAYGASLLADEPASRRRIEPILRTARSAVRTAVAKKSRDSAELRCDGLDPSSSTFLAALAEQERVRRERKPLVHDIGRELAERWAEPSSVACAQRNGDEVLEPEIAAHVRRDAIEALPAVFGAAAAIEPSLREIQEAVTRGYEAPGDRSARDPLAPAYVRAHFTAKLARYDSDGRFADSVRSMLSRSMREWLSAADGTAALLPPDFVSALEERLATSGVPRAIPPAA